MTRPRVALVVLCFLGGVVGFFAGRLSVSPDVSDPGFSAGGGGQRHGQVTASGLTDAARVPGTKGTTEQGTAQERLAAMLADMDANKRRAALRALGAELGATQPATGWQLLAMITGLADRQDFAEELCAAWARYDSVAALKACAGLPAGELQATSTSAAIRAWSEVAPEAALRWAFSHLKGSVREMSVSAAASRWALTDASAAAKWALGKAEHSAGITGIREIMGYWAETDPQAGARWAATLPVGQFRDTALESVLQHWTDQFPQEAARWIAEQPKAGDLMLLVAGTWAQSDPEAAAKWAATTRDPGSRSLALEQIVASWAAAAPEQALDWASKETNPQTRLALQQSALESWAADDPVAAVSWAERSPQPAEATDAVIATWVASSPATLERWLDARQPTNRPDGALEAVSIALAESAPNRAIDKAMTIRDAARRGDTVLRIYGQWESVQPAAAKAWLARNPSVVPRPAE